MERLELRHINPYLQHKVMVQYEGIINSKELSEYEKKYNEENDGIEIFDSTNTYDPPEQKLGKKIGFIKTVEYWNGHTVYLIGKKSWGLKRYYKPDFKLILRPLSDLTKEIEINGEKFVPIIELFKILRPYTKFHSYHLGKFEVSFYDKNGRELEWFEVFDGSNFHVIMNNGEKALLNNQLKAFEKLYEWKFDVKGLIEKGLAIDINTL